MRWFSFIYFQQQIFDVVICAVPVVAAGYYYYYSRNFRAEVSTCVGV